MTALRDPQWIEIEAVLTAHDLSLAADGGPPGVREEGLLVSALEQPKNRFNYEDVLDIAALAATYGVAIAKNHPFVDGNKRTAFITMAMFLLVNGRPLTASQDDATTTMLAVAAGDIDIDALADWIRANSATT